MSSVASMFRFALVGKTLYPTGRDVEGLMKAIAHCWSRFDPVPNIYAITDEIFVVRFHSSEQIKRAMEQGPWNIYGQIFLIKEHSMSVAPQNFLFDNFKIWFYFDNLPYRYRDENQIIELLKPITNISGIYPEFSFPRSSKGYKVQITVNSEDPLPLGVDADDEMGGKRFVLFIYLNLPAFFCVKCKRMGHKVFSCPQKSLEFGDDGISDGVEVAGYGRLIEGTGEKGVNFLREHLSSSSIQGSSSNPRLVAIDDTDRGKVADVSPNSADDQATYSPTTGLLPRGDMILDVAAGISKNTTVGPVDRNCTGGKSLPKGPNRFGSIARPFIASPEIVKEPNQLIWVESEPNSLINSLPEAIEGCKNKGKRSSHESSSSVPGFTNTLSKRTRLESNEEIGNQVPQTEIQQIIDSGENNSVLNANSTDFLGIQFGNLPTMIANMRREYMDPDTVLSSMFTAGNTENVMEPHRVEITRLAEIRHVPDSELVNITRLQPFPNLYAFGRDGEVRRGSSSNEDRHGDADFLSLDINTIAGARGVQLQIEQETQNVESVSESDTPPCGHTA